jgi:ankyrin repeat protein
MLAARNGHCEAAEVLLEAGAAVNLADNYGSTPLHFAAFNSHDTLVRMLLAAGADPNRTNMVPSLLCTASLLHSTLQQVRQSPLMAAVSTELSSPRVVEVVRLLIAAKADANLQDIVSVSISCAAYHAGLLLLTRNIFLVTERQHSDNVRRA